MKVLIENHIKDLAYHKELKEIPAKGASFEEGIVTFSGYGDILNDIDENGKEIHIREYSIVVKKKSIINILKNKCKFLNYF